FEVGKTAFFTIFARMFEFGKRPLFLHAPIVVKSLPKVGKLLFRSAFRHVRAPGELLAFDSIVLSFQVFHLDSLAFCPCFFPASECPIVSMASNTARFAKVES